MMSTLGVEVTSVEPGKVEMSLRHDDRFTQQHGFLHTGAAAASRRSKRTKCTLCSHGRVLQPDVGPDSSG
jgi:hypothetical protein